MSTIKEIAKMAGVSPSTASRALRGQGYISEENLEKVRQAAKELNYFPNATAVSLRYNKSNTVGIMFMNGNGVLGEIQTEIERTLRGMGYRTLITYCGESIEWERQCLESLISSQVDGVILFPISKSCQDLIDHLVQNRKAVLQVFSKQYRGIDSIIIDDEQATYDAIRLLLEKGHRRVSFPELEMNIQKGHCMINECYLGYERALKEYGLFSRLEDVYFMPSDVNSAAYRQALKRHLLSFQPTAILANAPAVVLQCLKELELRVPEDVSVIAYEDNEWCEYQSLTALRHPVGHIGQEMAHQILEGLENVQTAGRVEVMKKFRPQLIERGSTEI